MGPSRFTRRETEAQAGKPDLLESHRKSAALLCLWDPEPLLCLGWGVGRRGACFLASGCSLESPLELAGRAAPLGWGLGGPGSWGNCVCPGGSWEALGSDEVGEDPPSEPFLVLKG